VVQSRLGPLPTTTRVRHKPTNNVRAELNRYSNRLWVNGKTKGGGTCMHTIELLLLLCGTIYNTF
jgi:hypothetical protein